MEVIDDATINVFVRQAALVQLKNNIERRWQPVKTQKVNKEPLVPISKPEKIKIREYLLPGNHNNYHSASSLSRRRQVPQALQEHRTDRYQL